MMGHNRIESTMTYTRANKSIIGADMMTVQKKMDLRNAVNILSKIKPEKERDYQ